MGALPSGLTPEGGLLAMRKDMTTTLDDHARDWVVNHNPEALLADGYEDAFVGIIERCGQPALVVYDAWKCVEILIERDKMDPDEAMEFFQFNTLGAWAGDNSPAYLWLWKED
jgi:hypothetical protein